MPRRKTGATAHGLSVEDEAWLDNWVIVIASMGSCDGPNRRGDEDVLIAAVALRRAKREHPLLNP